jgi:hypothetical protein
VGSNPFGSTTYQLANTPAEISARLSLANLLDLDSETIKIFLKAEMNDFARGVFIPGLAL